MPESNGHSPLPDQSKLQAARAAALAVEARGDEAVTLLANGLLGTPEQQAERRERRNAEPVRSLAEAARAITRPPLYMADTLALAGERKVILTYGEDHCNALFDLVKRNGDYEYAVVAIRPNGNGIDNYDWEALRGREVLLLPTIPGATCDTWAAKLMGIAKEIYITTDIQDWTPVSAREGDWTWEMFYPWLKERIRSWKAGEAPAPIHCEVTMQKNPPPVQVADNKQEDAPASARGTWDACLLAVNKQGEPVSTVDNIVRVLSKWPGYIGRIWYDEFHKAIRTNLRTNEEHTFDDVDRAHFEMELGRHFALSKMNNPHLIKRGILAYAHSQPVRNEPKDWMERLVWDEKPRLDRFLFDYVGSPETEYIRSVSKNMWIAMVARIYQPGCKYDQLPYLKGSQGPRKSSLLEVIGGKWYGISNAGVQDKDFMVCLKGHMLLEIQELESIVSHKADVNRVKMLLSSASDLYRAPYAEQAEKHPRMSVFIGTTNLDKPLRDPTGNRRFWPIQTGTINLDACARDRDQLFAEAVYWFKRVPLDAAPEQRIAAGAAWWEVDAGAALTMQEDDFEEDPLTPLVEEFLEKQLHLERSVTVAQICTDALTMPAGRVDLAISRRIRGILSRAGWEERVERVQGKPTRRWWPKKE